MSAGAEIRARGLTRHFGSHVALADLDLQIDRGETFGLLGANGAGKTTFIRLLTGYLLPTAGRIHVDGVSPADDPTAVQARTGYVPETSRLYPELSVQGYLRFAAGLRGLRGADARRAIEATLARFRLEDVARRLIGNLSKGYRQRVSLAQGFVHDPPLLIVDEPTSGLDPVQRAEVRETIAGLQGQRTVLVCTHDLNEARALCSRVAILNRGRLMAEGESARLLEGEGALALFRDDPTPEAPPS